MSNTAAPSTTQVAEQLRDIQLELIDLLDRAKELLRTAPSITRERAEEVFVRAIRESVGEDDFETRLFPARN